MGTTGEMFLRMREEDFNSLTPITRAKFTYIERREENEYENNKDDTRYLALKSTERKAKEETQKYLFEKRHRKR